MRSAVGSRRLAYCSILLLVSVLGTAAPVAAQGEASATVTGIITDAQGGVLPGVTVTLRNVESGTVRTTVTEVEGQYRLAGLLPGRYDLTAELQGFGVREAPGITLTIGLVVQMNLTVGAAGCAGVDHRHGAGACRRNDDDRGGDGGHPGTDRDAADREPAGRVAGLAVAGDAAADRDTARAADGRRRRRQRQPDDVVRGRRAEPDLQLGTGIPRGAAVGHPGVPRQHQRRLGAVQRRRRRGADGHQDRHEPVPRRGLRVLPRHEPEHDGQVRAGAARHPRDAEARVSAQPVWLRPRRPDHA